MRWLLRLLGFGKTSDETSAEPDLTDLSLSDLKVGYYVDYDLKTWQVTASNTYDWGSGDVSHEWQLKSHEETIYLEKETDDEDYWSVSRKIPFGRLGNTVRQHLAENEEAPDEIELDGVAYYMDESAGGKFLKDGQGPGREMLVWDYEDDSGRRYLSIEQWGEEDFEASLGEPVEPYQFTNILPGESPSPA